LQRCENVRSLIFLCTHVGCVDLVATIQILHAVQGVKPSLRPEKENKTVVFSNHTQGTGQIKLMGLYQVRIA